MWVLHGLKPLFNTVEWNYVVTTRWRRRQPRTCHGSRDPGNPGGPNGFHIVESNVLLRRQTNDGGGIPRTKANPASLALAVAVLSTTN